MKFYTENEDGTVTVHEADDLVSCERHNVGPRYVATTNVGEYRVSTIFLALDHSFGGKGPPILYETMVFCLVADDWNDLYVCRYATREEATKDHDRVVEALRAGTEPEDL